MKERAIKEAWSGVAACDQCSIRHLALFADLEESDFDFIHQPILEVSKASGDMLYNQSDEGEYLYTVRSGVIKLSQYLPDGSQRIVRLLRTGDVAGLEVLITPGYEHFATVLREAQLCKIPRDVVQRLNEQTPRLHKQLLSRWHEAVQRADEWLTSLSTGNSRSRVARLLVGLSDEETNLCQLFSREDIGAMIGITTETTSRIIAEFKRDGILVTLGQNSFRADLGRLKNIANQT